MFGYRGRKGSGTVLNVSNLEVLTADPASPEEGDMWLISPNWTDDFDDGALDTDKFTSVTADGGTVVESGDVVTLAISKTGIAAVKYNELVDLTKTQKYKAKIAYTTPAFASTPAFSVVRKNSLTTATLSDGLLFRIWTHGNSSYGVYISKTGSDGTNYYWDSVNKAWTTASTNAWLIQNPSTSYWYAELETSKATGLARLNLYDSGDELIYQTDWLDLSQLGGGANAGEEITVVLGDIFTDSPAQDTPVLNVDWASYYEE